jgi:hypothetical protein
MVYAKLYYRITGFSDFGHRPVFYKLEKTTFRKLDLFPSSGEGETPIFKICRCSLTLIVLLKINDEFIRFLNNFCDFPRIPNFFWKPSKIFKIYCFSRNFGVLLKNRLFTKLRDFIERSEFFRNSRKCLKE